MSCSVWTDRRQDRRTDMTKQLLDFRNFANVPNNYRWLVAAKQYVHLFRQLRPDPSALHQKMSLTNAKV
jgi:hypothetical protein